VEEYRLDDAEYAIVTIGSMSGAGKDAVDAAREAGEKVGLIKIKTFRPFPLRALLDAVSKVKALGVVDRSVSFGWNKGPVYQEVLSALYRLERRIPALSFIGGLAGADITIEHFGRVIEMTGKALKGNVPDETVWLNEND
ncbi:MAG: phenylglyoxylate dehydrogenase, partial [Deltaproteobacteria bacterium]|nr:phenylglyoxylate dehydrogenase [Deltaproteobacteria bacterium]